MPALTTVQRRSLRVCHGVDMPGSSPEWNAGLLIECETPLDFLVVYAPLNEDFFCVEPVSNITDAFNMMARGEPGHGTRVLEAEESLKSRVTFSPQFGL